MNPVNLVRALQSGEGMRTLGPFVVACLAGLVPARALAHPSHGGGGEVRDHRSGSSSSSSGGSGHLRDHRGGSSSAPVVRDHRSHDGGGDAVDDDDDDDGGYFVAGAPDGGVARVDPHGPALTLEIGGLATSFRGPALARSGTLDTNGMTYAYGVTAGTPSAGDTAAFGGVLRGTLSAWPHLYVGTELQLGGVDRSPIHLMDRSGDLVITSQSLLGIAGVAGARVRRGALELDAEVAGGVRAVTTSIQTVDAADGDPVASEAAASPILEGRLRAALWLGSHLFLSAQVGAGAIDRSDLAFGFSIGTASRAYAEPSR